MVRACGSNTGRECNSERREQHRESVMVRVCGRRECDSESEGVTQGGSVTVRGESNTGRECDGEGVWEQHGEGL